MSYFQENIVDDVFDALEIAKKANSLLPPLPPDVKPVHIRVLHAIRRVRDDSGNARVTDINRALGFLLPNTTKCIKELLDLGIVEKDFLPTDKRVVLIHATELGEQYIRKYIISYSSNLQSAFETIGESNCITMIETIKSIYHAMQDIYKDKKV